MAESGGLGDQSDEVPAQATQRDLKENCEGVARSHISREISGNNRL